MCQVGSSIVSRLQELHQSVTWRSRLSYIVVHQYKLFESRIVDGLRWLNSPLGKTGGFRCGIRVEGRAADRAASGPQPRAADLVRVGFASNLIGIRTLGCPSSGKARNCQIEA